MRTHKFFSKMHRWLAAIIGLQILIWFVSGTFMAIVPIETVRGEHLLKPASPATLTRDIKLAQLGRALAVLPQDPEKIEIFKLSGRPVLKATYGEAGVPHLIDLHEARKISPLTGDFAAALVYERSTQKISASRAVWVTQKSTQYRGNVPVWRVDVTGTQNASFYVDPYSGTVKPVRTQLWRIYDFLWGLHIMDWSDHENFNTPWLVASGLAATGVVVAGFGLLLQRVIRPALRRRARHKLKAT
jgi:hypothetical protein